MHLPEGQGFLGLLVIGVIDLERSVSLWVVLLFINHCARKDQSDSLH